MSNILATIHGIIVIKEKRKRFIQPPTAKMSFDKHLARGLRFTDKMLSANRHGYATRSQILRVMPGFVIVVCILVFMTLVVAVTTVSIFQLFAEHVDQGQEFTSVVANLPLEFTCGLIFLCSIIIFLIIQAIRLFSNRMHDVLSGKVDHTIGYIKIVPLPGSGRSIYLHKTEYFTTGNGMDALEDLSDQRLVLYFLPRTRVIVSAEPA